MRPKAPITFRTYTVLVILFLASCVTKPTTQNTTEGVTFGLEGRLGIQQANGGQAFHLTWQHCGDHYSIRLGGPLGITAARITGKPGEVRLDRIGQEPVYASSPDELGAALGAPIPVSSLVYWVRAQPVPNQSIDLIERQPQGITRMQQLGWQLEFKNYQPLDDASKNLPHSIDLEQLPDAGLPATRLKLLISKWVRSPANCARV